MTLANVISKFRFWGETTWDDYAGYTPVSLGAAALTDFKATVTADATSIYNGSSRVASILDSWAATGAINIGNAGAQFAYYLPANYNTAVDPSNAEYMSVNPTSQRYTIDALGNLFAIESRIVLAHEIGHRTGTKDALYDVNVGYATDAMMNASGYDHRGSALVFEQLVSDDLNITSKRVSYHTAVDSNDPRYGYLTAHSGSFTFGKTVDLVRFGDQALGAPMNNDIDLTNASLSIASLVFGFAGVDTIVGSSKQDFVYGGAGRDDISSNAGDDFIFGEGDEDTLDGGAGDDRHYGGTMNDTFYDNAGNDFFHGGDYNKTSLTNLSGDGIDNLIYAAGSPALEVFVGGSAISTVFNDTPDWQRAIYVRDTSNSEVDTLVSIENITLADSDDRLVIGNLFETKIAGPNGQGGLKVLDMGGNGSAGDTVNLTGVGGGAKITIEVDGAQIESLTNSGQVVQVKNFENLVLGASGDHIINKDPSFGILGSRIDAGGGNDILDLANDGSEHESSITLGFGRGSGNDTLIGGSDDNYHAVPSGGNGKAHWNVNAIDMSTLSVDEVTVFWDCDIVTDGAVRYQSGDFWIRLNDSGETLSLGVAKGYNLLNSDTGTFSNDPAINVPGLIFSDTVIGKYNFGDINIVQGPPPNVSNSAAAFTDVAKSNLISYDYVPVTIDHDSIMHSNALLLIA